LVDSQIILYFEFSNSFLEIVLKFKTGKNQSQMGRG
jgi:hypothetical protein